MIQLILICHANFKALAPETVFKVGSLSFLILIVGLRAYSSQLKNSANVLKLNTPKITLSFSFLPKILCIELKLTH